MAGLKIIPKGNAGEKEYCSVPVPPLPVTGVKGVATTCSVNPFDAITVVARDGSQREWATSHGAEMQSVTFARNPDEIWVTTQAPPGHANAIASNITAPM